MILSKSIWYFTFICKNCFLNLIPTLFMFHILNYFKYEEDRLVTLISLPPLSTLNVDFRIKVHFENNNHYRKSRNTKNKFLGNFSGEKFIGQILSSGMPVTPSFVVNMNERFCFTLEMVIKTAGLSPLRSGINSKNSRVWGGGIYFLKSRGEQIFSFL